LVVANGEENASGLETALAGTQDCLDSGRRNRGIDGSVSVPRREKRSPVFALIPGRGSNLLSAWIAGEDELNDDGFDRLAATHLAHHRNESGIRHSRVVLSPKHAPLRSPDSSLHIDQMTAETALSHQEQNSLAGTAFLGSGQNSREWKADHEPPQVLRRPHLPSCRLLAAKRHTSSRRFRDQSVLLVGHVAFNVPDGAAALHNSSFRSKLCLPDRAKEIDF